MSDVLPDSLIHLSDRRPPGNGHGPAFDVREPAPSFPCTDKGNTARILHHFGRDIRYCKAWGKWTIWDGTRHARDEVDQIVELATQALDRIQEEIAEEQDESRRAALVKHAFASQATGRVKAAVELAQSRRGVAVVPEIFDADPWVLNVPNGTVSLRDGTLRAHRREDHLTKLARFPYLPDAACPVWDAFLDRVMDGNQSLISFLKRAAGYTLTGVTSEECLFMLYGTGRNGKSKFMGALKHVLGDYSRTTAPETLMVKREGHIPNDVAALLGSRFVSTTEVEDGARMAESLVKQITGGDEMSARFMRGEYFDFTPTFKIWIAGNHKPVIRGTDIAIWERILLVPFTVTIPVAERDKQLTQKLQAEGAGILRWMVEGCLEWKAEGLNPPPEVHAATEEYRSEMDVLARFLEDCCIERHTAVTPARLLYEAYQQWCRDTGEREWSQQLLGRKLHEHGYEDDRQGQTRVWQGVGLLANE